MAFDLSAVVSSEPSFVENSEMLCYNIFRVINKSQEDKGMNKENLSKKNRLLITLFSFKGAIARKTERTYIGN